jgi:hypothetical protein
MNSLESRISALEKARRVGGEINIVIIRGGFLPPGGDPTFGRVGDLHLERGEDESFRAFTERARAAAALAGKRQVIIGGLCE